MAANMMPPPAEEAPGVMDAKTALNQFCQRLCQRPVTRADIEYTVNKIGVQFQAIVKLNCIQGMEFAGELGPSPKEAEKAAAEQALKAHQMTVATLPPAASGRQKKKEKAARAASGLKEPDEDNPALTPKVKLNSICMRIVKRALQKGETDYETRQAVGGFHTTLTLKCLPGEWADKIWTGKVCTTKQATEQSAATFALEAIQANEELMSLADATKVMKDKVGKGRGGKGEGGKGKGKKGMDMEAMEAMMPWMKPRPTGPDLDREIITQELVPGEILEWRTGGGGFGWLKTDTPFPHEKARRDGKVYAHTQDVVGDASAFQTGTKVKFGLYVDTAGLGASQITMV